MFLLLLAGMFSRPSAVSGITNFQSFTFVCPFYSTFDAISKTDFLALWESGTPVEEKISELLVADADYEILSAHLGSRTVKGVTIVSAEAVRDVLSDPRGPRCAVVRTEALQPNWKRIAIDGQPAPWDKTYHPETDVLAVPGSGGDVFDSGKVTSVLMTGTTVLGRTTAYKMFEKGMTYPGEAIADVFENADLRHVSNEAAFWSHCPEPVLSETSIQFCSRLETLALYQYLGVNVIELTGNHLRDYDWPPLLETFNLFEAEGFAYYGAGRTIEEAALPYLVTHNENRIAFVGCNASGPDHVYVSKTLPGTRECDFDALTEQIQDLTDQGYSVIVTVQYYERYSRLPSEQQVAVFNRLAEAGAIAVFGTQAHIPQIMVAGATNFIHYGLGNLFFDQMDRPVQGTREEFLDRLIIYNGRLLQVELVTALLYDYAQPQRMAPEEREAFLQDVFSYAE